MEHELYHYGVKGMKWGVHRYQNSGEGITGVIRRKQRTNAENELKNARSRQRQVDSELRELRGYDKKPTGLAASKFSSAIRRRQIKSLEKTKSALKKIEQESVDALKELDSIEKHQAKRAAEKAMRKLNKNKINDLYKQYGDLEDQLNYGKSGNPKKNDRIEQQMIDIDDQISRLKKNR